MIKKMLKKITQMDSSEGLDFEEARDVMDEIMSGDASEILVSAYLTALSMKGETVDEIAGSAVSMRTHSEKLKCGFPVTDIVGTGGDGSDSFNVSTAASLVCAAAGIKVAKHGNRASSSKCGSGDVLEMLGINLHLTPQKSLELLKKTNFCFLFAADYHKAMRFVAPVRKLLGIKTIFNILGPLANPASAEMQLLGVYSADLIEPMTDVLKSLGVKRAMTVFGTDGFDEISVSAKTLVCELKDGWIKKYEISPEDFGFKMCAKEDLKGGDPEENAEDLRKIFTGSGDEAKRNAVALNAGAALYVSEKADTIEKGVRLAEKMIDSGKAYKTLCDIIKLSNEI